MLLFGGSLLTVMAPLASIEFLGSSLTFMMVYVWGRRHPYVTLSFLGIFTFTAPYLPWVLLGFSLMLGSSPKVDLLGMVAGGCWQRRGKGLSLVAAVGYTDNPLSGRDCALCAVQRRDLGAKISGCGSRK